ncbi:MAG: hypothetical protein KKA42_17140, partial [candidate division Zixibacteria bacterium]|nr:hypothetical protein [candidate division Zixibacteria bacterium]
MKKDSLYLVSTVLALFVVGRFLGGTLLSNNWSFTHFQYLPGWYGIVWLILTVGLSVLAVRCAERIDRLSLTQRTVVPSLVGILGLLILAGIDSFVTGAGNVRVAQIAQADTVILRWFEFGTIGVVTALHSVFTVLGASDTGGAVLAWRVFAYLCSALALVGAARLAGELTKQSGRRILYFVLIFFGGHSLVTFGFVGVEAVLIPLVVWLGVWINRLQIKRTPKGLAALWLIVAAGVVMYAGAAIVLPAVVYASLASFVGKKQRAYAPHTLALLTLAALLFLLYNGAANSLELSARVLAVQGKAPFQDYGLFSGRHLGDVFQLLFLLVPILFAATLLVLRRGFRSPNSRVVGGVWWLAVGGAVGMFVLDPVNSIVLDLPRFAAFLTPCALLATV